MVGGVSFFGYALARYVSSAAVDDDAGCGFWGLVGLGHLWVLGVREAGMKIWRNGLKYTQCEAPRFLVSYCFDQEVTLWLEV